MKKTSIVSVGVVMALLLASMTFAGPMHKGQHDFRGGMGVALDQLTPEKRAAFEALMDAHRQDVRPLHNTMWQKRMELKALSSNPNTKPEVLTALVAEMAEIRAQLQTKGDALRAKVRKDIGLELPDRAFGMGRDGGRGHGRGFHRGPGQGLHWPDCQAPGQASSISPDA